MIDIRPRIPCCASMEFGVKRMRVMEDEASCGARRPVPSQVPVPIF